MSLDSDKGSTAELSDSKPTTSTPTHSFAPSLPSELSSIHPSNHLDETKLIQEAKIKLPPATTCAPKRKKGALFSDLPTTVKRKDRLRPSGGSSGNLTIKSEATTALKPVPKSLYMQYLYAMVLKNRQEQAHIARTEITLSKVWKMFSERQKLADDHHNLQMRLQLIRAIKELKPILEDEIAPPLEDIVTKLDQVSLEQLSKAANVKRNSLDTKDIVLPSDPQQLFQATAQALQQVQERQDLYQLAKAISQLAENQQSLQDAVKKAKVTMKKLTSQAVLQSSHKMADIIKGQANPPNIDDI